MKTPLDLHITSEWAPLRAALFHDARNMIDWPGNEDHVDPLVRAQHPEQGPVRKEVFIEQHARFGQRLLAAGVELISPNSHPEAFCQAFTRDPCFVIGNTLFVSRMYEKYRQLETQGLVEISGQAARLVRLDRGVIEGGDVLVLRDDVVLVGTGSITTTEGIDALRTGLQGQAVEVLRVPHEALHLDCCLAPLPNGKCLFSEARLPPSSRELIGPLFSELIPLPADEDLKFLAANVIWLNPEEVVSTLHSPSTNSLLRAAGFTVQEVEYSEVIHLWGSVRCTVGPLRRV